MSTQTKTPKAPKVKAPKLIKIIQTRRGGFMSRSEPRISESVGTITELVESFNYTLEKGASWSHEKGNYKINRDPKSAKTLATNLTRSEDNAAANGYSRTSYSVGEITPEDIEAYLAKTKES